MAGWNQGDLPENLGQSRFGVTRAKTGPRWKELLRRTYALYRERFDEYFPLVLGIALVAGCVYFGLEQLRSFFANLPVHQHSVFDERSPSFYLRSRVMQWLIWCGEVAIVWIAMILAFGCVSAKVVGTAKGGFNDRIHVSHAFRSTMRPAGKLFGMALLAALATILFSSFLLPIFLRPVPLLWFYLRLTYGDYLLVSSAARGFFLVIFGSLLAWMALAIPALVENPERPIREALRDGLRETNGRQFFLFAWFGVSASLGAVVYWIVADFVAISCAHRDTPAATCLVFFDLIAVFLIALLAAPTFICLSLLYFESNLRAQAVPAAAPQ